MSQGNLVQRVERARECAKPLETEGLGAVGGGGEPGYWPGLGWGSHLLHLLTMLTSSGVRQPLWGCQHLQVCFTIFALLAGYSERGP